MENGNFFGSVAGVRSLGGCQPSLTRNFEQKAESSRQRSTFRGAHEFSWVARACYKKEKLDLVILRVSWTVNGPHSGWLGRAFQGEI